MKMTKNPLKSKKNFVLVIIVILLFLIFALAAFKNKGQGKEPFIPSINRIYRPYVRKWRTYATGKFYTGKLSLSNFLKKFGVL